MKLKQLLEQLNQLAKERPEALEMEVIYADESDSDCKIDICEKTYPNIDKIYLRAE